MLLKALVDQADRAAALCAKAAAAASTIRGLRGGDRVWTPLITEAEFSQGAAPSTNLVFTTSEDADFWAYRLGFYVFCKVIDPVNGSPDEIVYRPASFVGEPSQPGAASAELATDFWTSVDGTFALVYKGQELQNVDIPFAAAYTAETGKWTVASTIGNSGPYEPFWAAASDAPGGMEFDIPFFIPRGDSLMCRITPNFLGPRSIQEEQLAEGAPNTIVRQHKYKIVGILEGEKRVNALR